jgi:hypothetical protein
MSSLKQSPPFKAEHIGSLLRPSELIEQRYLVADKQASPESLVPIEQASIKDIVKLQQECGFHAVTNGEHSRHQFWGTFFETLDGMEEVNLREGGYDTSIFRMYAPGESVRRGRGHGGFLLTYTLLVPLTIPAPYTLTFLPLVYIYLIRTSPLPPLLHHPSSTAPDLPPHTTPTHPITNHRRKHLHPRETHPQPSLPRYLKSLAFGQVDVVAGISVFEIRLGIFFYRFFFSLRRLRLQGGQHLRFGEKI